MSLWRAVAALLLIPMAGAPAADSSWTEAFGGRDEDVARVIRATADGGYLLAGSATDMLSGTLLLVRTDRRGHVLWRRRLEESQSLDVRDAQLVEDGIVVTGVRRTGETDCPFLMRLSADGDPLWTRTYAELAPAGAYAVRARDTRGFVLAGWATAAGDRQTDVLLFATDAAGDLLWSQTYGGADNEWAADLCLTPSGCALATQITRPPGVADEVGLLCTDLAGTLTGLRRYGLDSRFWVQAIAPAAEGGFLLAWSQEPYGFVERPAIGLDRLDSTGERLWRERYLVTNPSRPRLLLRAADYGYLIAAYAISLGRGPRQMHVLGILPDGRAHLSLTTDGQGYMHWARSRFYWYTETAAPFGEGLEAYFHTAYPGPLAAVAIRPEAPQPERSERHAPLDSFGNLYTVSFTLERPEAVRIELVDCHGRLVRTVADRPYPVGNHSETLDGWTLPGGIYFLHIDTGERAVLQKVVLLK